MPEKEQLETIINKHGYQDFKWFDPKSVVVAEWVRMKCAYGCPSYGKMAACPPNTPSVEACRRFFDEYKRGIVIHIQGMQPERPERLKWSAKTNLILSKLERDVFLSGNPKAFLLFMDSCHLCADCTASRQDCKEPKLARPSPEGMAVDVFTSVRQWGLPIEVLTESSQQMNRYAFLLVD